MTTTGINRTPYSRDDSHASQREFRMLLDFYHSYAFWVMAAENGKPDKEVGRLADEVWLKHQALLEFYEGKESSTVSRRNKKAPVDAGAMRRSA